MALCPNKEGSLTEPGAVLSGWSASQPVLGIESLPLHPSGSPVGFAVGSKALTSSPHTAVAGALPAESQP